MSYHTRLLTDVHDDMGNRLVYEIGKWDNCIDYFGENRERKAVNQIKESLSYVRIKPETENSDIN